MRSSFHIRGKFPRSITHCRRELLEASSQLSRRGIYDALEDGADFSAVDQLGNTALLLACDGEETETSDSVSECVEILLEEGADENATNKAGQSAMMIAAGRDDESSVELLVEHGDANFRDKNGDTALHYAARSAQYDISYMLKLIVDAGCDPCAINDKGQTALDILRNREFGYASKFKEMSQYLADTMKEAAAKRVIESADQKNVDAQPNYEWEI